MSNLTQKQTKMNDSKKISDQLIKDLTELRQFFLDNLKGEDWSNYDKVSNSIMNVIDLKYQSYSEGLTKGLENCKKYI